MRIQEIVEILGENIVFAIITLVVFGVIFFISYYLIYKKFFKRNTTFSKTRLLLLAVFFMYIIMVFGVTLLNRGSSFHGVNLSIFSSFIEAWNNASLRAWQNIIFNILMFIPFGFLLPIVFKKVQKLYLAAILSLAFTLLIETFQYTTGQGIFDLTDIFNNFLGAIIGFGIIQGFKAFKNKNYLTGCGYLTPLILVLFISISLFSYYQLKDYGNLTIAPSKKIDLSNIAISTNLSFSSETNEAAVYKAPTLLKEEAEQFALAFFENLPPNQGVLEIIDYQNEAYYWLRGEPTYYVWIDFLNSSFNFIDFSEDEKLKLAPTDENLLKNKLEHYHITVPSEAVFKEIEVGKYQWSVSQLIKDDQLIDGTLDITYYNDDSIKQINQKLITYDKVEDVVIKSEQEAFNELLDGEFKLYSENEIKKMVIEEISIGYQMDSKGFYQPVYEFNCIVDGTERKIIIPAMK